MAVDGAVVDIDVFAVGRIDQLVATFHHAGPRRQGLHQQKLGDGELDVLRVPGALVLGVIEHELAAYHDAGGRGAGALGARNLVAAQQGADALKQQALAERLLDVVVGAEAQAHQFVDFLVLRGEEDYRHGAAGAQPLQQFHPVHPRHLHVEHREIDRARGQALQCAFAVGVGADQIALLLQRHGDTGEDVAVVVDQRNGLLGADVATWTFLPLAFAPGAFA